MNAVKVKRLLYVLVHLVGPLSYLTISTIWGAFFTTKSTFENISDNLGVKSEAKRVLGRQMYAATPW
ncbi:hypothetical protein PTB13_25460, partial [Bacillus sp. MHSD17]|nr:hypothetical protein [Bacillus sp. MHSD17]